MSVERAQELLRKFSEDKEFRVKIRDAGSQEGMKQVLTEAGFGDVSPQHVQAAAGTQGGELSDAELEAVAGGSTVEWAGAVTVIVTGLSAVASAGAGAAAAAA